MRPKFAIIFLTTTGVIFAGIFLLKQQLDKVRQPVPAVVSSRVENSPDNLAPVVSKQIEPVLQPVPVATLAVTDATTSQWSPVTTNSPTDDLLSTEDKADVQSAMDEQAISLEVMRLLDLSHSDDPEALPGLLAGVTNQLPTIRQAALEGIKNKGDTNAISELKRLAAAKNPDSIVRKELLDAADFLALPSAVAPAR